MTEPNHDLSKLKIRRDHPSPAARSALKRTGWLAGVAVIFLAVVFFALRGGGSAEVTVALAQVAGAGSGSSLGITANGYVVARTKASVSSKISGRLAYLGVEEGSVVKRGDVLASLENDDYRAILSQAEAEVLRAEAAQVEAEAVRDQLTRDLRRGRELLSDSLISEREVEDLAAQLEARVGEGRETISTIASPLAFRNAITAR